MTVRFQLGEKREPTNCSKHCVSCLHGEELTLYERHPSERDAVVVVSLYQMALKLSSISCFDLAHSNDLIFVLSFLAASRQHYCSMYETYWLDVIQHASSRIRRPGPSLKKLLIVSDAHPGNLW